MLISATAPLKSPRPGLWGAAGRIRLWCARHLRFSIAVTVVVITLVAANLLRFLGPAGLGLVLGPLLAIALIVAARRFGLSWDDLGLARRTWVRGSLYAAAGVAAVAVGYVAVAAMPMTRSALLDARYQVAMGPALVTALLVIPLGTVLLEEVAFRGVLQALVTRHRGIRWGMGLSSGLFGLWHVLPSLGLTAANGAVGQIVGHGLAAQVVTVIAVVVFTALAGLLLGELRRRSGSLLAAAGLHWATNGIGVLAIAVTYATLV